MKITVKDKESCRTRKTHICKDFNSQRTAAIVLLEFFDNTNFANDDGYYMDGRESILEMLEEEENNEVLEETVAKSLKEFAIETEPDALHYYVAIKHGIRYFMPDNLTDQQLLDFAVDLVNSGDEEVIIEND